MTTTTYLFRIAAIHVGGDESYTISAEPMTAPEAIAEYRRIAAGARLQCGELGRETYIISERDSDYITYRHDDPSEYSWDDYDGDVNPDGTPADDDDAHRWTIAQDIAYIREHALEPAYCVTWSDSTWHRMSPKVYSRHDTLAEAVDGLVTAASDHVDRAVDDLDCPTEIIDADEDYPATGPNSPYHTWRHERYAEIIAHIRAERGYEYRDYDYRIEARLVGGHKSYLLDPDTLDVVREI